MSKKYSVKPKVSDNLMEQLLHNRGVKTKKEKEIFLQPGPGHRPPHPGADHSRLFNDGLPSGHARAGRDVGPAVARPQTVVEPVPRADRGAG